MYFHIDEAGNTGSNLFDPQQPVLSYGVLASTLNVDALGTELHREMLRKLGVDALHASQLGAGRLEVIATELLTLHRQMRFKFGYSVIEKRTYAVVRLFEAVFDAGLNRAVPWLYYWTPMRFAVIHFLALLVNDALLKVSWELTTDPRIERRFEDVAQLLRELRASLRGAKFDRRLAEVMDDAFAFGIDRPSDLDFGSTNRKIVSPNAIGFQFVFAEIARQLRLESSSGASVITIDHQQEFNAAQLETHRTQKAIGEGFLKLDPADLEFYLQHPLFAYREREELMPAVPGATPVIGRSPTSVGLQVADVYLWLINRHAAGESLPPGLTRLAYEIARDTFIDGITMSGFAKRYADFEAQLPKFNEMTPEQLAMAQEAMERQRQRVQALNLVSSDS